MTTTATIRAKGQLTIPLRVGREANLEWGAVVEFEVVEEGVLLRPRLGDADAPIDAAFVRDVIARTVAGYEALRADP